MSTHITGGSEAMRSGDAAFQGKEKMERDVFAAISKPKPVFYMALLLAVSCVGIGASSLAWQIYNGLGVAGIMNPVGWGVYITDFVFWVGIAHSGTLISAILYLFRAKFRNRFNRTAEAMTVFAVLTAGLFPLIHLGRIWLFYWLFPYPNQRLLWVNFKSPLVWDVFAVSTYLTVSVVFWYIGLVPDLAIARRLKAGWQKTVYGIFSLGWTGTFKEWQHYNQVYKYLAALAAPLVLSVHSVVSWDFAMGVVFGWHTTIFAPYFVAGAIFSGCGMVITLMVPMRKIFSLEEYLTPDDFEKLARLLMLTGLIVSYAYIMELALAVYTENVYEYEQFVYRLTGDYAWAYWTMILCNVISPLTLFVRSLRRNLTYLFILSIPINIGMWFERFNIIVISLAKDFDPFNFGLYHPSWVELGITLGSFGWFFTFFLLFTKTIPVLPVTELKEELE
ncbi:MAG TPA: polysulfide reductase NrfD [Calditrichia bacterium]|nr:polysulfide reductase NrfD [Calditrichia bacterium]